MAVEISATVRRWPGYIACNLLVVSVVTQIKAPYSAMVDSGASIRTLPHNNN